MTRTGFMTVLGLALVLLGASANLRTEAGPRPQPPVASAPPPKSSIQDALLRPFDFPFDKPTTLSEVADHLTKALGSPVVLDRAGLDRIEATPDDTVELSLRGARLKTGLRLLLDQLDLTYRVEAEDNLLVITDLAGSADPASLVLAEVEELHRDVHDLQDALDEVRAAMGLLEEGPMMRKPTIIDEVPPPGDEPAPAANPPTRRRPGA